MTGPLGHVYLHICIVLYCIVLYCIVLYCIVLYCIVLTVVIPPPIATEVISMQNL
jgi:hypothetical protein